MRRLLPLALLLAACAKPHESAPPTEPSAAKVVASALTPEDMARAMDVPVYPGATAPDGMSSAPEKRGDGSTHYAMVLATGDSPSKVLAWYAKGLDLPALGGSIIGKTKKGNDLLIKVAPEAGRTLVRIKSIAYGKSATP